jgi:hypothetical protein
MVIATPICADDAADINSMTKANNSVRMKRICMVIPLPIIPRLAGNALLPRIAEIEGRFSDEAPADFGLARK